MASAPVPLTVISGFLGCGKTTLLNRLLREGFGHERVGVVVNDFGSVAVDASLIEHAEEEMLVLRNGCICCTLATDLIKGLLGLLDSRPLDRLLMETSGVTSMPGLRWALQSKPLRERLRLERVVVVANAVRHPMMRAGIRVVDEQVGAADVLLLNRCDQATPEQIRESEAGLRAINAGAPILATVQCQVAWADLAGGDGAGTTARAAEPLEQEPAAPEAWTAARLRFNRPPEAEALEPLLRALAPSALRLKGFVLPADGVMRHIEVSGEDVRIEPWTRPVPAEALNVVVAIGREAMPGDFARVIETDPAMRGAIEVLTDREPHHHGPHGHDHGHGHGHGHEHEQPARESS